MPPSSPQPRSLLVIKPSSLGDIVHALQVVQGVARQLPGCRITWVARDRFAPLVEAAPFVDEVIFFHRKDGWRGLWAVMKQLRSRRFDVVWDMQGLLRSGLMAAAARAPLKWGRRDAREGAGWFTRKVAWPAGPGPHHAIPVLLEFARTLGITGEVVTLPLELRAAETFPWQSFFDGDPAQRFVIFTDSRGIEKEWRGFEELTRLILERLPNSRVAWCAGQPVPNPGWPDDRFLNLTGCPFAEMLALARQPSVFIGNDSGPMHLSAASGNLVLAIFGPTSPARFGPWPPASPRTASITAPNGILAGLTPAAVFAALQELIARNGGHELGAATIS